MKKRLSKRLDQLREQPEHIRIRAASLLTIISGVVVVIAWLTLLLPAQLYLNNRGGKEKSADEGNVQGVKTNSPGFAGEASQLPQQTRIPRPQPTISPTPTPTPTPTPDTVPVKMGE